MNSSRNQFLTGPRWRTIDAGFLQHVGAMHAALQAKVVTQKPLQAETAAELAALLPVILDRAFRGEL